MKIKIFSFLLLSLIWVALSGFNDNLLLMIFMFLAPLIAFIFAIKLKILPENFVFNIGSVSYFIWLLKEIFISSISVIKIACRKNLRIHPVLKPIISRQQTDVGIVVYANSITLTPGTVTLSTQDNVLLVHAIDVELIDDLQKGEMDNRICKIMNI